MFTGTTGEVLLWGILLNLAVTFGVLVIGTIGTFIVWRMGWFSSREQKEKNAKN